ncbi:beta-glucosidase [Colletotrichum graminicola]|uniref:Probable beta-glucosidase btgE n=1 Tax=Colletotrichum graminicola (strain M1.001 / M2 / FGSC 10212) TaxID=645133 RepID=E3QER4_COLGM|nr:beta-glucosidase [Colletotrichum graminicola M1.001]EFQ29370.1 beta-glucosidase [Colletotrichum graminicola M1.001]WDK13841.1 beta-glucosidase [Colletotrichum graminicola]
MKGSILAVAAAIGGVSAAAHRHAQAHGQLFKRGVDQASVCVPGCTTIYTTIYGEPTLVPHKPSSPPAVVPSAPATTEAPPKPTSTQKPSVDVPTPVPEVCPTPGTYTFPATTITVSQTTTVCAPETTKVPAGTHTIGGVTTVVVSATTVVCPYATAKTSSGVVTSVVETTTYVCPTPGTYTIAPTTTTVTAPTNVVYPVVTTVNPGTYVRPAIVTTITETSVVVVCPFTSQEPVPTTSSVVVPAPVPTTSAIPAPVPTTSAAPEPVPTTTAKASSSAPAPSSSAPATGGGLGGNNGDHWAITYTPYSEDASGSCKSGSQVDSDIASIKNSGFRTIRIYSTTDCNALENVGAACEKYGLKMILGIFVKDSCDPQSADIKTQVDAIASWQRWDMVELVVVGNECIFQGRCSASSLKQLIVATKVTITAAGYSGPYTTAETVGVWQQTDVVSEICDVVDIVGGQIHPYFNAQTAATDAGTFVQSQIELLESSSICGSKPALNLECGWPASGSCNGLACPGTSEQAIAIASIKELAGSKTVFFSFHNDLWKAPGACGCEQSWGCGQLFL